MSPIQQSPESIVLYAMHVTVRDSTSITTSKLVIDVLNAARMHLFYRTRSNLPEIRMKASTVNALMEHRGWDKDENFNN